MEVGLLEGWRARNRRAEACPYCASRKLRYSRRRYDGVGAALFKLRPVKCVECGGYFPVVSRRSLPQHIDLVELHVPFRPTEMDPEPDEPRAPRGSGPLDLITRPDRPVSTGPLPPGRKPGRKCPDCGARSARPVRDGEPPSFFRLDALLAYRCSVCNGSFKLVSYPRVFVFFLLLSGLLAAPAYVLNRRNLFGGNDNSPRMRKNQVPKVPPPVLR